MIHSYRGHWLYNENSVKNNVPYGIGVYYCGHADINDRLIPFYIGKSIDSKKGIAGRLLDHLAEENWPDVTIFGYCLGDYSQEVENFEIEQIYKFNPKYNQKVG